jgi:hypothetical protein
VSSGRSFELKRKTNMESRTVIPFKLGLTVNLTKQAKKNL